MRQGAAYDPATDTWRPIAPAPDGAERFGGRAVWVAGRMVVAGGTAVRGAHAPVAVYDPATDAWRLLDAGPAVDVVSVGSTAYLLVAVPDGGDGPSVAGSSSTVPGSPLGPTTYELRALDPARGVVTDAVPFPVPFPVPISPSGRVLLAAHGDQVVVGVAAPSTRQTWLGWFDPATRRWATMADAGGFALRLPVDPQMWASSTEPPLPIGDRLVLLDCSGLSTVDPRAGTATHAPPGFCNSGGTAVWTGRDVLLWPQPNVGPDDRSGMRFTLR